MIRGILWKNFNICAYSISLIKTVGLWYTFNSEVDTLYMFL